MLCILFRFMRVYTRIHIFFSIFEIMNYYHFSFDESQFTFSRERSSLCSIRKDGFEERIECFPNNLLG